jgi:predicted dinucleotide-binding enzyme
MYPWNEKCTTILGDYAIGGAIAGAGQIGKTLETKLPIQQSNNVIMAATEKQNTLISKGKVVTIDSKRNPKNVKDNKQPVNPRIQTHKIGIPSPK